MASELNHGGGMPISAPFLSPAELALALGRSGATVVAMLRGTMPVATTEFQALGVAVGRMMPGAEPNPGLYIAYALGPVGCLVCARNAPCSSRGVIVLRCACDGASGGNWGSRAC